MEKILNDLTALIVPLAKDLIVAVLVFFIGFKVVNIISKRIRSGKILKNVDDIQTVKFSEKDVVRHKLVQDIIKAYDKYEEAKKRK